MSDRRTHSARGFTILETVLAVVVGGLVIVGCTAVFLTANRAERAFSQRFDRTSEMWTVQTTARKTFMNLLVEENSSNIVTSEDEVDPDAPRPRVILEADLAVEEDPTGYRPQRFEVTVGRSPVPSILGSRVGTWLVEQDRAGSLDFASTNLSAGAIRGVFELRPSGERELIMSRLGLADPDPKQERAYQKQILEGTNAGWTLWWRPILSFELGELEAGSTPRADTDGSPDEIRNRLAGAIPLLTNIDVLAWQIFKGDAYLSDYTAAGLVDLPAYATLDILLLNGQYASWMFEIGWTFGEDPVDSGSGANGEDEEGTETVQGGGTGRPGDNGQPGRPGRPDSRPQTSGTFDAGGRRDDQ